MPSINELERAFLLSILGGSGVGESLSNLRAKFYSGVADGSIVLGGGPGGPIEIADVEDLPEELSVRPTDDEVTATVGSAGFVTAPTLASELAKYQKSWTLAGPADPDPAGAVIGDILFVPNEAVLPIIWSFDGTGLADETAIVANSTSAPNQFGQVNGSPIWDTTVRGIRLAAADSPNDNVRILAQGPATDLCAFGFEFQIGTSGDAATMPDTGAYLFYGLASSGGHVRINFDATRKLVARNAAGSVVGTTSAAAVVAGRRYFCTIMTEEGVDNAAIRVRDLTDDSLFWTQDVPVGTSLNLYTGIVGKQSASAGYNVLAWLDRLIVSPVDVELYQW